MTTIRLCVNQALGIASVMAQRQMGKVEPVTTFPDQCPTVYDCCSNDFLQYVHTENQKPPRWLQSAVTDCQKTVCEPGLTYMLQLVMNIFL